MHLAHTGVIVLKRFWDYEVIETTLMIIADSLFSI